ncbi:MAG TPA: hypothetical protein VIK27_02200 [Candidatus Aquilonibacter sp.]
MTTRKDFLVAGTLAAAALPTLAEAAPLPAAPPPAKLEFDLAAFNASLGGAQPHKHLFAAVEMDGGSLFGAIRNTLDAYRDIGVASSDVLPVGVLYHGPAVLLGFDDQVWNDYVLAAMPKFPKHGTIARQIDSVRKDGGKGNPCLPERGGDSDRSIRALVGDAGMRLYICNNATRGMAHFLAETLNLSYATVYDDLTHHLAPNAMLVPAGVWAVHAIQEQHFTYLQTSLAPPV